MNLNWLICKNNYPLLAGLVAWISILTLPAHAKGADNSSVTTGILEVVETCYLDHAEQALSVTDEKTGQKYRLNFAVKPAEGHLTGERVRVRGQVHGGEMRVLPAAGTTAADGLEVLAAASPQTNGTFTAARPKVLYGAGTNASTVVHKTLVELLIYSDYATNHYTATDIVNYSNEFFAVTGNSVNTAYLEDSFGAVGFAGDVVICNIADTSGDYNTGTWMGQGDAAATAQGYTPGNYAHKVYITSGAGGWAGLAAVGGGWSMDFYTDGGTICHELGHNLGFNHASTQWNNTSAWNEYGDSSDFMGGAYDWRHNNGPHKVQLGWVSPQTLTNGGTYQIGRVEDVPASIAYPQVLKFNASSPPNGWPYYFSYKQPIGFDVNNGYNAGVSIHRYNNAGGNTAFVGYLSDGGIFTDSYAGLTVKQITHDTGSVTIVVALCTAVAQPYTVAMTSEQLVARTTMLVDVAGNSLCNPLTITNFDATTAKGGTVTRTSNQLFYTPPGVFTGNDTFNYTVVDLFSNQSSSIVTIIPITQPHYNWDANGATAGTGGTGVWNTSSLTWDDGVNHWPGSGTANWALFGGTAGTVSAISGGVMANGLAFRTDGYILQNNSITFNGATPTVYADTAVNGSINSTVSGTAGLTKTGLGTVTLGVANNFTGTKTVSQGTLAANHASALGVTSTSLTLGDTNSGSSAASFKVDSGVTGAVVLAALNVTSNSANPSIILNAGSALGANASELTITNLNLNGNVPLTIHATSTGTSHSTAQDINYRITGNGVPAGSTALILDGTAKALRTSFYDSVSAANNFSGDVVINGSVSTQNRTYYTQTAANQNLGFTNNSVTVNWGATWTLVWGGETCGALNGAGNISMNNQNALNNIGLTIGNNGASGDFSGAISGGFNVLKTGVGNQTFSGANSYSGTTTISQGTLTLNNGSALPATADIILGDANSRATTPTLGVSQAVTMDSLTVGANVTNATIYATPAGTIFLTFSNITLNSPLTISKANMGGNWLGIQTSGKITGNGAGAGNDTLILTNAGGAQAYWQANDFANDFLGNVHITSGDWRLQAGADNLAIPDTASLTLDSGASLGINSSGISEAIDGLNGAGTLSQTYGTPGVFSIGVSGGNGNFSGSISSGLAIAKIGGGTQTFSGANSYSGGTTLSGGQLNLNNASAIGSGAFTIGGVSAIDNTSAGDVTLTSNNAQNWNADFSYVGSVHNLNLGTGAVTLGGDRVMTVSSNTLTVGGAISGGYGLMKAGAGTLTLGGASGYTGATIVNGGTLNLSGSLTASPTVTINTTGTLNGSGTFAGAVTANNGGTVAALNNTLFTVGTLALGATGGDATTLNVIGNGTTIAGKFAVSGSGGFVVNGNCTVNIYGALPLTVPGTNVVLSYSGARGGSGSLILGSLPGRSSGYLVDTGSQIQLVVTDYTPADLRWVGTPANIWDDGGNLVWSMVGNSEPAAFFSGDAVTFDDSAADFSVNLAAGVSPGGMIVDATNNYILSGAGGISGAGGLVKSGSGTLTLSTANSFSGGTTVSNGTVAFVSGGLGSGAVTQAGNSTVRWIGNNTASLPLSLANGITATLDVTSNNVTESSALSGTGTALVKSGAGTLTLGAANTFTGGATVSGGTLQLDNTGALNSTTLNNINLGASGATNCILLVNGGATTLGALTVPAGATGAAISFTQNSASWSHSVNGATLNSPLTINQANASSPNWNQITWSNKISGVGGGPGNDTLIFNNTSSMQHYFTMAAGVSNDFSGNIHVKAGLIALQGYTGNLIIPDNSGLIIDSGANVRNNTINPLAETFDTLSGAGTFDANGKTTTITLGANNGASLAAGAVFGGALSSTFSFVKIGTGKQTFAGAGVTYSGTTAINNGILSLSNCTAYASGSTTVASPGVLDLDGNNWILGKVVGGTGCLSKSGTGTVTITNTQAYTGTTTVNAGTLLVSGSLGTNTVTVSSNATLGGTGTIGGIVSVQNGGTLAPGRNGIGVLTLGKPPLFAGTTLMGISKGASPNAGKIVINGQPLNYGGTLTVTNVGVNPLALGDSFTLFSAASYSGNFSTTNLPALTKGLKWNWTPTSGVLSVVNSVNTTPTNVVAALTGSTLALSWPADRLGWHLQYQTNALTGGLDANWITVPGSDTITSTNIAIDPLKATVFYRLVYP